MTQEFEIKTIKTSESGIIYEIKRKGLPTGILYLESPYEKQPKKEMILK